MSEDTIVEEVRTRGRALTARYHNDANELLRVLCDKARRHPQGIVDTVRVVAEESPSASVGPD